MLIRIEEPTWSEVTTHLFARDDVETAAILLAEAIETDRGTVLAVRHWAAIPDDGYQIRRFDQIRIDPIAINRLVRPARDRGLSVLTIHSHPMALEAWFSNADDAGDARLLPSFATQVPGRPHGALVLARSGAVVARLLVDGRLMDATVRVIGRTLGNATGDFAVVPDARFARQALALGEAG